MRRSAVLVALGVALLVVSCSSRNEAGQPDGYSDVSEARTATTTSEAPTATIEQFGAIIAEHRGDWSKQVDKTKANCLDPATVAACGLGYMTLGMKADTIHIILTGAHEVGNPTYIGEPPAEIESLLADTEIAASEVNPAVEAFQQAGCVDPMDSACLTEYIAMDSAVDELSGKLDAWAAY